MAIAFDAAAGGNNGGAGGNYDFTGLTVGSGSDRWLLVGVTHTSVVNNVTAVTWDQGGTNQAMTKIGSDQLGVSRYHQMWSLKAPTSGNKTLRVTQSGGDYILVAAAAYTGVDNTGSVNPEASAQNTADPTPISLSVTTLTDNAWLVMTASGESGTTVASTGMTKRAGDGFGGDICIIGDSGGAKSPTGSYSIEASCASGNMAGHVVSLAPAAGGGGGGVVGAPFFRQVAGF